MISSGDAFIDARRCDAIKYCFRDKGNLRADLIKARNCINAAIKRLDKIEGNSDIKVGDKVSRNCDKESSYIPFYEITAISELFATIRNLENHRECKECVSNLIKV